MKNGLFNFQCSASATLTPIDALTLRLLHTAKNHCSAMSQRATIKLRVLHARLMYSTSLSILFTLKQVEKHWDERYCSQKSVSLALMVSENPSN